MMTFVSKVQSQGLIILGWYLPLQLDNSMAVTYINNMGGTKSLVLNELTIQMWEWSIEHFIWISAVQIAGASNHEADKKSRIFHDQHEYIYVKCVQF